MLEITGRVGASPEIYAQINREEAWGQVIAFSGSVMKHHYETELNGRNFLCALNHSYTQNKDSFSLPFEFLSPEDSRECFILSNKGTGISVLSSTGWIDQAYLSEDSFTVELGSDSILEISIPAAYSFKASHPYLKTNEDLSHRIIQIKGNAGDKIIINFTSI
jgi:hypothetical protein